MTALVPVLLYHRVGTDTVSRGDRRWILKPRLFCDHLQAIVDSGRQPLLLDELARGLRGLDRIPDRPVVITFDDGFADNLYAFEQLATRGLSATLYVTTGWIGRPSMLAATDLCQLVKYPIEVGAHSVSHPRLDELPAARVDREVNESARALEDILGHRIKTFAYPHGAYDARTRQTVIAAGYQSAAAVKNALSHPGDDPFAVARWTVTAETPAAAVEQLLRGGLAPKAWAKERLRTRAYRGFRRIRRAVGQNAGKQ